MTCSKHYLRTILEQFLKHTNDARIQQLIQKSRNVMIHRVIR
ncbi:hypothetical protein B4133_2915 [Bacillus altitudinis]|nr:hypothetical protein B4133_2915 [Bacillus altitudinis]